ncbi:NAD(P)/FAD-dependent oxidoreductase [Candidatus Formimonas warabiya]|uniref:FAD-binding domain-containing protein n=1 Tax=Formimonas warabiya TaxID=1761012 RepID=A0A3G1KUH4_FORW1|nr:NAD(P)/FAD-dependent oxidoreductase [Candidatus Formimonas warabiya]ATW25835.1 hypothetical protein DCMF_14630 [Candidatus Formimonas warabiya]
MNGPRGKFDFDVAIVGAGPAGATAAKILADRGIRVVMIEKRTCVGIPVQCAEFVPALLTNFCAIPPETIAQKISHLETVLPDGSKTRTAAPGFVLHRALFDKYLVTEAVGAGAALLMQTRVTDVTGQEIRVRGPEGLSALKAKIIIGADGPKSLVREKMGIAAPKTARAWQGEIVLSQPQPDTKVFFHPDFYGGYGWLFPKGKTANVGFGMVIEEENSAFKQAKERIFPLLGIEKPVVLGSTAGTIPIGGFCPRLVQDHLLLIGDAAGATHPMTGAGIAHAVISGTIAARITPEVLDRGDLSGLRKYEEEVRAYLGNSLDLALMNRQFQEKNWHPDPERLAQVIRRTWIAFKEYGNRAKGEGSNV